MNKQLHYFALLIVAVATMALTSCHDDHDGPYFEDIIGSWVSDYGHDYYGDYDILGTDAVRYDFYIDHTGRYTYYSTWGQEYIDFDWYAYGDQLQINYYDGSYENLYYGFDNWGYLLLSPYYNFSEYTGYRPAM